MARGWALPIADQLTGNYGVQPCVMATSAGVIVFFIRYSFNPNPSFYILFMVFGIVGLFLGAAGLLSARGTGRIPGLSLLGVVINLGAVLFGTLLLMLSFAVGH